ncbi:MAG: RNA polymerase sigma factor [Planctomyces sp.]|jgi:RNA polymerase sigma-70 factor (ECF subfamily)
MPASEADRLLIAQIRSGDGDAWKRCIDQYEGRLLAFVRSRLHDRSAAEDIVQETFLGFIRALPNYDSGTPVESWLFSIASHKLIDAMRRSGRRPAIPLSVHEDGSGRGAQDIPGGARAASSMMRSQERGHAEAAVVENCLRSLIAEFRTQGAWERLCCVELIFVLGWQNKNVAARMGISEQAVANHKFFVVNRLKEAARSAGIQNSLLNGMGLDS